MAALPGSAWICPGMESPQLSAAPSRCPQGFPHTFRSSPPQDLGPPRSLPGNDLPTANLSSSREEFGCRVCGCPMNSRFSEPVCLLGPQDFWFGAAGLCWQEAAVWGGAGKAAGQSVGHQGPSQPTEALSPGVPDPPRLSPGPPDWSGNHEVSVVETDYEAYALLYTESFRGPGQDFRMATLYSTCPTPAPAARPEARPTGQPGDSPSLGVGAERGLLDGGQRLLLLPQAAPRPPQLRSRRNSPPSPRPRASQRIALSSCHRLVRGR